MIHICNSSYIDGRDTKTLFEKQTKSERCVAQVVEYFVLPTQKPKNRGNKYSNKKKSESSKLPGKIILNLNFITSQTVTHELGQNKLLMTQKVSPY